MAYDNTNRGSIWKNEKKEKETHADFTGKGNFEGIEIWINAWKRKPGASENSPPMTFTFRRKEAKREDPISTGRPNDDMNDDIPF